MIFDFRNLTRSRVEKNFFHRIAKRLVYLQTALRNFEVSLVLVDNARIRRLNRKYRREARSTDVLSFSLGKPDGNQIAEIFISVEQARLQAKEMGHSLKQELSILFIHGLLHILGYNDRVKEDKIKMFKEQDKIFKSIKDAF